MPKKPYLMSVKDAIRDVRKTVTEIAKQISETRREVQALAHDLKITPLRNILLDEIKLRRPLTKLRRALWGEE